MLKVHDLMTKNVYTLRETDSLHSARSLMMMQRIRHIPIVSKDGAFIGLVTHRDILAATISKLADIDQETQSEIDMGIPLHEIMRTDVRTVPSNLPLKEAADILYHNKYGCLPVVDNEKLLGIITEADFLKLTINLLQAMENGE